MTKNSNIIFFNFHFAHLVLPLALGALQPEDQLLGGLGLLPQDWLGLPTKSLLFAVIPVIGGLSLLKVATDITFASPGLAWTLQISCTASP